MLTLEGLPVHTHVDVSFVLAVIDDWRRMAVPPAGPDLFVATVDDADVFTAAPANHPDTIDHSHSADIPDEVVLWRWWRGSLGGGVHGDSAYDVSRVPALRAISHADDSLTISIVAQGLGYQGDGQESWAIDDLRVTLLGVPDDTDRRVRPAAYRDSASVDDCGIDH